MGLYPKILQNMVDEIDKVEKAAVKAETPTQIDKRLKARKQVYKETYRKGLFLIPKYLLDWLNQDEVIIRIHSSGSLDDGKQFVNITVEGFLEDRYKDQKG